MNLKSKTGRKSTPKVLPRGRHKLSSDEVKQSQRKRLTTAMLELMSGQGFAATTVSQVVTAARVSSTAYYRLFADKEDCLIAAFESEAEDLRDTLRAATIPILPDFARAARSGLRAFVQWWQERKQLAWVYFVEFPALGPKAVEQRRRNIALFIELFAAIATEMRRQKNLPPMRATTPSMLVHALSGFISDEVRAGRVDRLLDFEDDFLFLAIKMLADDQSAHAMLATSRT